MSIAALGIWTAMLPGMVLGIVREWIEAVLGEFWAKPLASCPRCMVTLYGTAAALVLGWPFDIVQWLIYVPCAVGLQEMFHKE